MATKGISALGERCAAVYDARVAQVCLSCPYEEMPSHCQTRGCARYQAAYKVAVARREVEEKMEKWKNGKMENSGTNACGV